MVVQAYYDCNVRRSAVLAVSQRREHVCGGAVRGGRGHRLRPCERPQPVRALQLLQRLQPDVFGEEHDLRGGGVRRLKGPHSKESPGDHLVRVFFYISL